MIPEVKTYLAAAADVLSIVTSGLESARAGTLSAESMQLALRTLDKEARRARQYSVDRRVDAESRRLLEALARDASKLKGEARKLIR